MSEFAEKETQALEGEKSDDQRPLNRTTDIHAYIKVARPYSPKTQIRTMIDKDAELTAPVLRMNFHRGIIVHAICTVDDVKLRFLDFIKQLLLLYLQV